MDDQATDVFRLATPVEKFSENFKIRCIHVIFQAEFQEVIRFFRKLILKESQWFKFDSFYPAKKPDLQAVVSCSKARVVNRKQIKYWRNCFTHAIKSLIIFISFRIFKNFYSSHGKT